MKNRIRELRAEKNITQLRLSLELEVSQETVSAYENGKHLPSLKSLIKMADIFHVSTDYLIGRSDVRKPSATSPLPNEDIALLDCFHDLDTVDKARLVAYAQGLSDKSLKDYGKKEHVRFAGRSGKVGVFFSYASKNNVS